VIQPSTTPPADDTKTKDTKTKEDPPPDEDEWTFEVEDVSEDPGLIEAEVKAGTVEATLGPAGTVKGRLRDSVSGDPLIGAVIEVVNGKYKTKTDGNGEYSLRLPPGVYELRLRGDASQPIRVSQVEVRQDGTVDLDRELEPLAGAGQVVKVEAEMNRESEGARLLQRKESVSARDLLSRDEIAKSGGGSTSSVARRIVGCTVVHRRYLYCRGLGHRYGNTLFDGARVPSPEPDLRTVPLDIFPSGALSAINIQKTFTPDVPGDFAGASVQLESREVPDEFTFEVSAEIGANTAATGRTMATNRGYFGADAFGFGNLSRALPEAIPTTNPIGPNVLDAGYEVWDAADVERHGELFPTDTRVRFGSKAPPNFGAKATAGWGREYGNDGKFGVLGAIDYKTEHETLREQQRVYQLEPDGTLDTALPQVDLDGPTSTFGVGWSGIGLAKWKLNKQHRLELLGFYSREAEDESRSYSGDSRGAAQGVPLIVNTRLRYVMRSIAVTRLGGKHTFPKAKGLQLDWFGSYAQARRDDPQIRDMVFVQNQDGSITLNPTFGGGKITYLDLTDHTESGAVDLALPFKQWGQLDSKVKVGVWVEGKQRQFLTRRFYVGRRNGDEWEIPEGTGDVFGPDTIGGGEGDPTLPNADPNGRDEVFYYRENIRPLDNYDAEQEIYATYGLVDLPIVRWFKLAGGARMEASYIDVRPFDLYARNRGESGVVEDRTVSLDEINVLPSVSLIFSPTEKMNVRLVGAQTLARPEFRELAPFEFQDFVGGNTVQGNTSLTSSTIWNADLRWEWFPSASEVVAVSLFYKYFDQPIERIAGASIPRRVSYRNADDANNLGLEFEVRKNLEFLGESFDNWSMGANVAVIRSRVNLGAQCNPDTDPTCDTSVTDVSTNRKRPLQGQSPYVANAYLDYYDEDSGTSGRLLYNAFGRRIEDVGALGLPDVYEEAIHNFDLVLGQALGKGFTLSFEVENILNYPRRFTQGKEKAVTYIAWPGTLFSLGLTYKI
jgi:hypothetical protein